MYFESPLFGESIVLMQRIKKYYWYGKVLKAAHTRSVIMALASWQAIEAACLCSLNLAASLMTDPTHV